MAQEVILLEDVKDLGRVGATVRVAEGFARNYLLPRNMALPLTPANLRRIEAHKRKLQQQYQQRMEVAKTLAADIAKVAVTISMQATEDKKLYGAVTVQQIAAALAAEGINLERHSIELAEPIRELGVFNVNIKLHAEVSTQLKVDVVRA